jgi:plastocyanin
MRRLGMVLVAAVLAVGFASCGDDDDDNPAIESETDSTDSTVIGDAAVGVTVTIANTAFDPDALEATAGEVTVDVTNEDSFPHTFTIDGTAIDVEVDGGSSGSGSDTLEAGEYEFHCRIHSSMTGTLTVT